MKYCSHCGNELFEQAVVCTKCGCQVRDYNFTANNQQSNPNTQSQANTNCQPQPKKTNAMCLTGFILSFIFPLLGLIFSCIGKSQITQNPNQEGETYAKAGIIISSILLGLQIISSIGAVIWWIFFIAVIA